jgi:hypothetical protein
MASPTTSATSPHGEKASEPSKTFRFTAAMPKSMQPAARQPVSKTRPIVSEAKVRAARSGRWASQPLRKFSSSAAAVDASWCVCRSESSAEAIRHGILRGVAHAPHEDRDRKKTRTAILR